MLKAMVEALGPTLAALGGFSALFTLLERHKEHRERNPQRKWIAAGAAACVAFVLSLIYVHSVINARGGQTAVPTAQAPLTTTNKHDVPVGTSDAATTLAPSEAPATHVGHRRAAQDKHSLSVSGPIIQSGGGDRSVTSNVIGGDDNRTIVAPVSH